MNSHLPSYAAPTSTATTHAARQREVETALLVQTLCGHAPCSAVQEQLRRYVAGELNREQAFAGLYASMR